MSLFDTMNERKSNLTTESLASTVSAARAFKKQALSASNTGTRDENLEERLEEKQREKEEKRLAKAENRKEALHDAQEGIKNLAKATGKGVKETARILYNLALGKDK
nr:MAG TPA: hypothetical protein [Caudoviricetes sp.]